MSHRSRSVHRHVRTRHAFSKAHHRSIPIEALESRRLLTADVWQNVDIGGGGYVTGLVADPNVNGLIYARTDIGGAYRWNATTSKWTALTDKLPSGTQWDYAIQSIAVDPSTANTVYIQTGKDPATYDYSKIYRSTDAGSSWTKLSTPTNLEANANGANRYFGERLGVDPNNSSVIYLASINMGLWKSTNGATTTAGWSQITAVPSGLTTGNDGLSFVMFDKNGGTTTVGGQTVSKYIYVGVWDPTAGATDGGIWKTSDGGVTWAQMTSTQATPARAAIDPSDGTFYATFTANGSTNGALMTAARAATALTTISPPSQPAGRGFAAVAIDPQIPGVVMVTQWSGQNMATYRSTDHGSSWSANISGSSNKGTRAAIDDSSWWFYNTDSLLVDPHNSNSVFASDFFGVQQTANATAATPIWNDQLHGIEETFPIHMASAPSGYPLMAAMADVNGLAISDPAADPTSSFIRTSTPTSFLSSTGIDFSESNTNDWVRVGMLNNGGSNAYISTNDGAAWTTLSSPAGSALGGRVAMSATDANHVVWYDQNGKLFYTNNALSGASATWSTPTGLTSVNYAAEFDQNKSSITSDRVAANTFYAYLDGGSGAKGTGTVWRSTDGGATWAKIATITYDSLARDYGWAFNIVAAPNNAGEVWVSLYAKSAGTYIFKATGANVGSSATFTQVPNIASGQAEISFGAPAPGHTNPAVYVLGSYSGTGGMWQSDDDGANWTNIADPNFSFALNQNIQADRQVYGRVYVGTSGRGIFYGYRPVFTWTGGAGGTGTAWNTAADWSSNAVPTAADTAEFGPTGTAGSPTISLGANQTVDTLTIDTTNAFTIGSTADNTAGYSLSLNDVNRQDVAGTELNQTIAVPVALASSSTWTVDGSGALVASKAISGTGFSLTKLGAGELDLGAADTFTGGATVTAGTVKANANGAIPGSLTIGGGSTAAAFTSSVSDAINNSATVTVASNGTFNAGANESIGSLVETGGGATNLSYLYLSSINLTGSSIGTGSLFWNYPPALTTQASATSDTIAASSNLSPYYNMNWTVADGAAPLDLQYTGLLANNGGTASTSTITKTGAGVMVLGRAAGNSYQFAKTAISAGTLLVTNTTGSATGTGPVQVNGGGTIGGSGIIGGATGDTNANLTAVGTTTTTAVVAPGTLDATSGVHIVGTLTVGSSTLNNSATLGDYSQLAINFNAAGTANDVLAVNGTLNISSTHNTLNITVPSGTTLTGASYTLATFTSLTGSSFASATGVPSGYTVNYNSTSITLVKTSGFAARSASASPSTTQGYWSNTRIKDLLGPDDTTKDTV